MILDTIVAATRERVAVLKKVKPIETVRQAALVRAEEERTASGGTFTFPFERALTEGSMNFICEIKKASPSKGVIVEEFPFVDIAKEYEEAGAAAISVLTEPAYFMGVDSYVTDVADVVTIPILRKDFIVDEYQIYESKVLGASAILLLCSVLDEEELARFMALATELGLSCLVEAHNEEEVKKALAVNARIIGINNRDLKDFSVDVGNSIRLRSLIPDGVIVVAESGIKSADEIEALREHQIHAALIGETLMRSEDKTKALTELFGPVRGLQVKICGLSRTEDITVVNNPAVRPTYAGFVFAESPRRVSVSDARNLISQMAPQIQAVGVFVNEDVETMAHLAETVPLQVIQLHGDETEDMIKQLRQLTTARIWKAVRVQSEEDVLRWNESAADLLLFDAYKTDAYGGTGHVFDWKLLKKCTKPFILAGGIYSKNVARAIRNVKPYAIDASSGLETDGVKDKEKIFHFMDIIKKVRN